MRLFGLTIGGLISATLLITATFGFLSLSLTEVLGFITGAVCVWLTVEQNIWNWPIGIANNFFYIVLFLGAGLYADTGLQLVYIVLGFLGWYWWLHGGENRTKLTVSKVDTLTLAVLGSVLIISTAGLMALLTTLNGSAPFLDALTTTLSLCAQYLLTRKFIENWYVWIAADVIYIGLYASKGLYLTSGLYFIFLCMCIMGWWNWRNSWLAQSKQASMRVSSAISNQEIVHG